ncbi:MAG: tetratricopeptide repeat protein [Acidobacteria bacterium]|nr:tetratricopeptide repeat protein [Acidobacteriota bacterium]
MAGAGCCSVAHAQQPDLKAQVEKANRALGQGEFGEAASIYRLLIKYSPDNGALWMNLGLAEYMQGEYRQASGHLRSALKFDSSLLPAHIFLGASLLNLQEPSQAILPLQRAVSLQPDNAMARQFLGDAYLTLGKFDLAREQFLKLCSLVPQNALAWVGLGQSYEGLARNHFHSLQRQFPNAYWTKFLMAEEFFVQQKYPQALALYRQVLAAQGDLSEARSAIVEIYRLTDHLDWAKQEQEAGGAFPARDCQNPSPACSFQQGDYERVLQLVPATKTQDAEAMFWLARACDRLAVAAFAKLDELPESADRHQVLAQIYTDQYRYVDAVKEWRAALQIAPNHLPYEKGLAVALYESREYEAAEHVLQNLLQAEPDSGQWAFLLGSSLLNQHKASEAIPYLAKAVKKAPKLMPVQQALAAAYLQTGDPQSAIPYLETALPLDQDGSVRYQLAQAYHRVGRHKEGEAMLQQYQQRQKPAASNEPKEGEITPP